MAVKDKYALVLNYNGQSIEKNLTENQYKFLDVDAPLYLSKESETITVKKQKVTKQKLILNDNFFRKVEDKHRYNLCNKSGKWILQTPCDNQPSGVNISQCDRKITERKESNNILVILESPHKKEYDLMFNPLSPANGKTGKNFLLCFVTQVLPILESLGLKLEKEKYSVCFVNPVPFQTSLYEIHNKEKFQDIRNKVWKTLYKNFQFENDFKQRVQSYKPVLILNGCTDKLQPIVESTINSLDPDNQIKKFNISHPSNWNVLVHGDFLYDCENQNKADTSKVKI
jgi:hypothetical protein